MACCHANSPRCRAGCLIRFAALAAFTPGARPTFARAHAPDPVEVEVFLYECIKNFSAQTAEGLLLYLSSGSTLAGRKSRARLRVNWRKRRNPWGWPRLSVAIAASLPPAPLDFKLLQRAGRDCPGLIRRRRTCFCALFFSAFGGYQDKVGNKKNLRFDRSMLDQVSP